MTKQTVLNRLKHTGSYAGFGSILALLFLVVSAVVSAPAHAAVGYEVNFEFTYNDGRTEVGRFYTTTSQHTWQKGLRQSYLKLTCRTIEEGKTVKLYSTSDHFSGLRLVHKVVDDEIEINLVHQTVQSRLHEIRELSKKKCREYLPLVNKKSEIFRFKAVDGNEETRSFDEKMSLHISINKIHGN